jgi:hypothetical protein
MNPDLMHNLRRVLLVGLSVLGGAFAQGTGPEILPVPSTSTQPAPPLVPLNNEIPPTPLPLPGPVLVPNTPPSGTPVLVTPAPLPTTLDRVSASLKAVQTGSELTLNLTLLNAQANAVAFSAGRDSTQNCAAAPLVRVLKVGSRDVVYPNGEKRICTQEQTVKTALLGGSTVFSRTLNLAPGEYVIESWFQGFAGPMQTRVKLSAPPLRVSVK